MYIIYIIHFINRMFASSPPKLIYNYITISLIVGNILILSLL